MTKYLAGVLTVIAGGVVLIAFGLLSPRTTAIADDPRFLRSTLASDRAVVREDMISSPYIYVDRYGQFAPAPFNYPAPQAYPQTYPQAAPPAQPVQARVVAQAPRSDASASAPSAPSVRRVVETSPKRNWKKTALVIGGSTAAGAGIGALVGGKKGALIGAAVGGGASTVYETMK